MTQTVTALVIATVMLLGMLGGVLSLTFRTGTLSGQILAFMRDAKDDRAEILVQLGKIEERLNAHIERHGAYDRN
jgi:uncharacterized ion transporter superfamily protein YfcC